MKEFEELFKADRFDIRRLRSLCFNGIPDCSGYRALSWKILLGYLTTNQNEWKRILRDKRQLYQQFIGEWSSNSNALSV